MTDRESMEIGSAVQDLNSGDPLTDEQVNMLVEFYRDLERRLFALGPQFWLARVQVTHLFYRVQGYQDSRRS